MEPTPRHSLGQRIMFWLAANPGGRLLGLLLATCRVSIISSADVQRFLVQRHPTIATTWHRGAIFFLYYFGFLKPAIMVSRSKDGEFLARFIELFGGVPVRGSSSKGGGAALKAMAEMIKAGQVNFAATVADGPRGPRYQAKAGMILLAAQTGLPLLPIMWSADRMWVFKKAWDRTIIPKPFAKITMACGRAQTYPEHLNKEQLEVARLDLEQELNRVKDQLDQACGYQEPA